MLRCTYVQYARWNCSCPDSRIFHPRISNVCVISLLYKLVKKTYVTIHACRLELESDGTMCEKNISTLITFFSICRQKVFGKWCHYYIIARSSPRHDMLDYRYPATYEPQNKTFTYKLSLLNLHKKIKLQYSLTNHIPNGSCSL